MVNNIEEEKEKFVAEFFEQQVSKLHKNRDGVVAENGLLRHLCFGTIVQTAEKIFIPENHHLTGFHS